MAKHDLGSERAAELSRSALVHAHRCLDKYSVCTYNVITHNYVVQDEDSMSTILKTRIVKIGNSQGVRIPKLFLEQTQLSDDVELELQPDHIVIRSARRVRAGWDAAFQAMAMHGDDRLLDGDAALGTTWDEDEWSW
jgi:antitoxin MazE